MHQTRQNTIRTIITIKDLRVDDTHQPGSRKRSRVGKQ